MQWGFNHFRWLYLNLFLQADEYFLFAGLIGAATIVFVILAIRYDYVDESEFYDTENDPLALDSDRVFAETKNPEKDDGSNEKDDKGQDNKTFEAEYSTAF